MPREPEQTERAALAFYADGEPEYFGMPSKHAYTDEELRNLRRRSNVERPSRIAGAQEHVLLTTCAAIAGERDAALAELKALRDAVRPIFVEGFGIDGDDFGAWYDAVGAQMEGADR